MTIGHILPLRYGKFEYLGQDASQTPLPEYMDYEKMLLMIKDDENLVYHNNKILLITSRY